MITETFSKPETNFINPDKLRELSHLAPPSDSEFNEILNRARDLKGLSQKDTALLLACEDPEREKKLLETAAYVKQEIYGKRMVLFAPLYTGNKCSNNCTYCAFRASNKELKRTVLNMDQIRHEVEALLKQGHKRLLMLCGESSANSLDYFMEALATAYDTQSEFGNVRRINVEIAPMETKDFARLKTAKIGTYACFQETYDPDKYKDYHHTGPKKDYLYRLTVMDRAMAGGIDDVGIGALFGLADYKFEVLAMLEHAAHLERNFGCGPHTISVPRLEPALNAPTSEDVPFPVSDHDFKKIVAVLRISLPYTGIILSTRESEEIRNDLFAFGVSQISAASRTNPGAYAEDDNDKGSQFSLGDHRSLDEVIDKLIDLEYIPSFCTGCYRKGRVGQDFMDMAKPGLIKEFCMPNGVFTFAEYLHDFASPKVKSRGLRLIDKIIEEQNIEKSAAMSDILNKIRSGERDLYY